MLINFSKKNYPGFIQHQLQRVSVDLSSTSFYRKSGAGFTLIELLIVVVIVGILTALIFSNFVSVRQRSRDSQRKSDLKLIQSALERYRSDQGIYPAAIYTAGGTCATSGPFTSPNATITYLSKVPCEPLPTSCMGSGGAFCSTGLQVGKYFYYQNGSGYNLHACLENKNDNDPNNIGISTICPGVTGRTTLELKNP